MSRTDQAEYHRRNEAAIERCRKLASDPSTSMRALMGAIADLRDLSPSSAIIPILLPLLFPSRPLPVRIFAIEALSTHPYPEVLRRLDELTDDPEWAIRGAAQRTLGLLDGYPILCAECRRDHAKVGPDIHCDGIPRPLFCSDRCAIDFALRAALDTLHYCRTQMTWEAGQQGACSVCVAAELVGVEAGNG